METVIASDFVSKPNFVAESSMTCLLCRYTYRHYYTPLLITVSRRSHANWI
jgi:hypothetical protein